MWCLTPSIYSQEQGEESWEICCSDTALLAQSKSKHIHEKFCLHGSLTEAYLNFLSGTMLKLSEQTTQTQPVTSNFSEKGDRNSPYVAGSRNYARTYRQPEKAQDLTASEAASGARWQGSFARCSPDSSLWKTAQCSLLADSDEFSETWPRWGSMRNGASYLRPTPAPPHLRERIWILAYTRGITRREGVGQVNCPEISGRGCDQSQWRHDREFARVGASPAAGIYAWRPFESSLGRMAHGVAHRVDRLKAIGNGQVPLCAATAWSILSK